MLLRASNQGFPSVTLEKSNLKFSLLKIFFSHVLRELHRAEAKREPLGECAAIASYNARAHNNRAGQPQPFTRNGCQSAHRTRLKQFRQLQSIDRLEGDDHEQWQSGLGWEPPQPV